MTALVYYNNISYEEKVIENNVQVRITVSDRRTETSRVILDKDIHILLFFPLFIFVGVPFLILLHVVKVIALSFAVFKKQEVEMTSQEVKEYFATGKGYLNNLSDEDKRKLFTRRKEAPLGL